MFGHGSIRRAARRGPRLLVALGLALAFLSAVIPVATAATPPAYAVARERFTVALGDASTTAELTYPAGVPGPFPTVLLLAGSGPYDLDFTIIDRATGQVKSAILRQVAESLTARGYAVVRYNKRYITKPNDPEEAATFYQRFTIAQLLADADAVYAATRIRPQVDPTRLALYGWSEGTTLATQLALRHPEVAALILHGPVAGTFAAAFHYQEGTVGVGFLRDVADANVDGQITLDELLAALRQRPGTAAGFAALVALDPQSSAQAPKLNAALDGNGDGKLALANEVMPFLEAFFANFDQLTQQGQSPYGPQYATSQQLPLVAATIGGYRGPSLILQGASDANVPPAGARQIDAALATAGNADHTLLTYPGLGHSLGPAATVYDDTFLPIAAQPLADLASWLDGHLGATMPGLPNTGGGGGSVRSPRPLPMLGLACGLLGLLLLRRQRARNPHP